MYVSNSIFNILISLDNMGVLKRDRENEAMQINTLGNEYKIVLERRDKKLFTEVSSDVFYKCTIKFVNMFNVEVLTLFGNEIEMSKFLDVVYYFLESKMPDTIFQLNSIEGMCYIYLDKEYDREYKRYYNMRITRYNEHTKAMIPIVTIKFDDETISSFIDALYFSFLIDIDSIGNGDMAKIYRYIDPNMRIND